MAKKVEGYPKRSFLETPGVKWRDRKPDYTMANEAYLKGRSKIHKDGSLEKTVEDLVKTWEMEASHKVREQDWESVDQTAYFINANGGKKYNLAENIKIGNYNVLMSDSPIYNAESETFESSHDIFRTVFKSGFPWEVLEVFSGPPKVSFTWRHWGTFEGDYKENPATGETIELFGSCVATVDEHLKIRSIEVYYDANPMLMKLASGDKKTCPFKH